MKPNSAFSGLTKEFWANVKHISQEAGYVERGTGRVGVPSNEDIVLAFSKQSMESKHIIGEQDEITAFGRQLQEYFAFRASVLNDYVEPRLMSKTRALRVFREIGRVTKSKIPVTMNKQKGSKRKPAYLTAIVNMIVESNSSGIPFEHNPRRLTTVSDVSGLRRTSSRWYDGAFPSSNNPVAVSGRSRNTTTRPRLEVGLQMACMSPSWTGWNSTN